jgi:ATP-binding cassette subfamily C protein
MFAKREEISIITALRLSLNSFDRRERISLTFFTISQSILNFLDLVGVALLGLLGSLSVSGVQSVSPSGRVGQFLDFMRIGEFSLQIQVTIIGALAGFILALKTILSMLITRRNLRFLAFKSAEISVQLVANLMSKTLLQLQSKSRQSNLYAVTQGVNTMISGILGSALNFLSDLTLLIILFLGLIVVNPTSAFATVTFFAIVALILHRLLNVRVKEISDLSVNNAIELNSRVLEITQAYRELVVHNRREYYLNQIAHTKRAGAEYDSKLSFVPHISKYALDISLVLGALMIAGLQFSQADARQAVGSLLVFLVAAMRIGPAVLRLQQGLLSMRNGISTAKLTLKIISDGSPNSVNLDKEYSVPVYQFNYEGFSPIIEMSNVSFGYSKAENWSVSNFNLKIEESEVVAIVGPSGAGKTSVVDLILGIFPPESGSICISGLSPLDAFKMYPGAVSYVPQEIYIADASIRENVALGFEKFYVSDEDVWMALKNASLEDFVKGLDGQLDFEVGESGSRLSGGQRQRLGIARALFTKPKLIVLDEATSALDSQSEQDISRAVKSLRGNVTVLLIAHRLSTVQDCDRVIYLNNGKIEADGTFIEVKKLIPSFAEQAQLLGL